MSTRLNIDGLLGLRQQLDQHPVYAAIQELSQLRLFMQHHVFSVWDFMSLVKSLQKEVAPVCIPWLPQADGNVVRFINELVLEEECDQAGPDESAGYASHFELYCGAMVEVGADVSIAQRFIAAVGDNGIDTALNESFVPAASSVFTRKTFAFIGQGKPHVIAAALALGREHIIPQMFRSFLSSMNIAEQDAPLFYYYLNRHIHLDEDFHAPMSIRLLEMLCADDETKIREAEQAASQAIEARIAFWDGVHKALTE